MILRVTIAIYLLFTQTLVAQNLVKNGSFENYSECPNELGTFSEHVVDWSTPTSGTTDYFNTCSEVMGAPENFNGVQHPKFGDSYAGIYFYAPLDYREYIQVPLKRLLKKERQYELTFYISLAEGSDFAVKDFGVLFSYQSLQIPTRKNLSRGLLHRVKGNKHYSIEINHPKFHENKTDWLKVTTTFKARGFEKYLVLGNLRDNEATRKIQTKRRESKRGAYYYIDMITLTSEATEAGVTEDFEIEKRYIIENILFEFDDFQIQEAAKQKITKVVDYLKKNDVVIIIHGHTDNQGTDAYNQKLSLQRARAISNYLIEMGVSKNSISISGHGKKNPIGSNAHAQGRRKNRRVEFEFKKKED